MPNYRLLHLNYRTGRRSKQLSRLERDVWIAYMLSADDFGVCPASARKFQADDPWLAKEPAKRIEAAFEVLIKVGLVSAFDDGGDHYLYQHDWQDYQKIKHPSKTTRPPVPGELLEKCSPETQKLFREFHPKRSALFPLHARACDAHANANANANAHALEGVQGKPHAVKAFLTEHERLFSEQYGAKPAKYTAKDAKHAKELTDAHGERAYALLEQFFASKDPFIAKSGHGLGVLASGNVQNKLIAEMSGRAPVGDGRDWAREFVANG